MPSDKSYLKFVMDKLSGLEELTYRAMMGEYIVYYRDKIVGGIYDNRLLVKPVKSARALMPAAKYVLPYEDAKQMLQVENVDDCALMERLFCAMYAELPAPKQKKKPDDA